MSEKWGGARAQEWTAAVLARYGRVCTLNLQGCTIEATTGDHIVPRKVAPELQYVVSNGRPACLHCNQKRATKPVTIAPRVDDRAFFESTGTPGSDSDASPPRASGKISSERRGR
jgi:hypothetical protein